MAMALLLTAPWTRAAGPGDLYLFTSEDFSLGESAQQLLEDYHTPGTLPEVMLTSSATDDAPMNFVELGFSFPFLGNSRVREAGIDPNGMLRFDVFSPASFLFTQSNVIGAFAADMWPGEAVLRDAAIQPETIKVWKDASQRSFSVLWDERAFFGQPGEATFGLTVYSDGRATFYLQDIPSEAARKSVFNIFVGMRGPTSMDAAAVTDQLSETDLALQETWREFAPSNGGNQFVPGVAAAYVNASLVTSNKRVDMCMLPDRNLATLAPEPVCVTMEVNGGGTTLTVGAPNSLFGCARAGIPLMCWFVQDDVETPLTVTSPAEGTAVVGVGQFFGAGTCALPNAPGFVFNASDVVLVYADAESLRGGGGFGGENASDAVLSADRIVLTQPCANIAGPSLVDVVGANASTCPVDALGEPGVLDCAGQCAGDSSVDSAGLCCLFVEPCTGRCSSDVGAFVLASVAANVAGGLSTVPTNFLECCAPDKVDCDGTCEGCTCDECECPGSAEARAGFCGTPRPTPATGGGEGADGDDDDSGAVFQLPTIFLFLVAIMVTSSVIRIARFYFFGDQTPDWLIIARGLGSEAEKAHLSVEEIEENSDTVVYEEARHGPHQGDGADDDDLLDDQHGLCPICISDFEDQEDLRRLPCGHFFHVECIDPWLLEKSTACPMCKQEVLVVAEDSRGPASGGDAQENPQADSESEDPQTSHNNGSLPQL